MFCQAGKQPPAEAHFQGYRKATPAQLEVKENFGKELPFT